MEGDRQLDRAEVGAEMAASLGDRLDQVAPDLARELVELGKRTALEVGRPRDRMKYRHVVRAPKRGSCCAARCSQPNFTRFGLHADSTGDGKLLILDQCRPAQGG